MNRRAVSLSQILALVAPWYVLGVGALGGTAVVAGVYEPSRPFGWLGALGLVAVIALGVVDARQRLGGRLAARPFVELEGPVLWVVGCWMVMRLGGVYAGHLTPLAAGLVAWLVATFPQRVSGFAAGVAITLEVGLAVGGHQPPATLLLHLVVFTVAAVGLARLAHAEAFRRKVYEAVARRDAQVDARSRAKDFGLTTEQAPAVRLPVADDLARHTVGRATLDYLAESFNLQLQLLREVFELTTAAVLWRSADEAGQLRLRGFASSRDLLQGPYDEGAGLPGSVLHGTPEVAVAPVHRGFSGLPYYADSSDVGAALSIAIPADMPDGRPAGVLCVDRQRSEPWSERERKALRAAARKLALDVETGRRLKAVDHERATVGKFGAMLQKLNGAQDLESVAEAATEAVRALVSADLAVVSVLDGPDVHRVVCAAGRDADRYAGLRFASDEGLVGKAVKVQHPLPSTPYRGKQVVFTAGDKLSDMRALRVVPLAREDGSPIGALTVAALTEDTFASPRREMLDLVAQQVAIKLDLAQAYEQIREMATTDGLTGLKNHRTFQQAFDLMLSRAQRRRGPLCVILTDIDHFKRLNDTYGHPFGDQVLREVARVLEHAVRQVDQAARYGGEEFAVLVEDSDAEGGINLAERIREDVAALNVAHDSGPVSVTLSLGVAAFPGDGRTKQELIERADSALYHAKESGRNRAFRYADLLVESEARAASTHSAGSGRAVAERVSEP